MIVLGRMFIDDTGIYWENQPLVSYDSPLGDAIVDEVCRALEARERECFADGLAHGKRAEGGTQS